MIRQQTALELIEELNSSDEKADLEAKKIGSGDVGESFYETISALSNEPDLGGGSIILGISRDNDSLFPVYTVSGVADPDKIQNDIVSGCANKFSSSVRLSISTEQLNGSCVVKVDVPEASRHQKPVYLKRKGLPKGAYRRVGAADVAFTDEDLAAIFQDRADRAFDHMIIEDASIDDISFDSVNSYRKARANAYPDAEELNWDDEELLTSFGAIVRNSGSVKVTVAGLLTFGRSSALKRVYPSHRVDYIRMPGNSWMDQADDDLQSVDMRGPLITLIPRVIGAVVDDLPKTLTFADDGSGQRQEAPVIPTRVIREAVVNALMHRSYQTDHPVQVIRYANRLEIRNPGHSLKNTEFMDEPGSFTRNPHIASVLHDTRFAETKGTGLTIMKRKMLSQGLASPAYESNRVSDTFKTQLLFHAFMSADDVNWLEGFEDFSLTPGQMKALVFVREVGAIDNSTYRSLNQSDMTTATKRLRELRSLDLLSDRGGGAATYWVPGDEFVRRHNVYGSSKAIHVLHDNMDGAGQVTFDELPDGLQRLVKASRMSRKWKTEVAVTLILQLCRWRPLSAANLSELLDRRAAYLSQKYLGPLVSEGRLAYTHPEMVQHPEQKYYVLKDS